MDYYMRSDKLLLWLLLCSFFKNLFALRFNSRETSARHRNIINTSRSDSPR